MQSTTRSATPRSAPHTTPSDVSIGAISVQEAPQRNTVSWGPSVVARERAQTSHGRSSRSGSVSRRLSRSQSAGGLRPLEPDLEPLEDNEGSMRELSEFLRTKKPPSDNWMSVPDNEENRSFRKSALKIFGRSASSRARPPKLMQLPDIAVAAKTLNGSRHIAISIPIQYDHPENAVISRPGSVGSSSPPKFPPPVTVLKPVVEAREPTTYHRKVSLEGNRDGSSRRLAPSAEPLGPGTAKTLNNYYTQLHRQHKARSESISSLKAGESRSPRSHQAGSSSINRQDDPPSDTRHSGGTVHSTITPSPQDYSRRMNSVSTSPSTNRASPVRSDLSLRKPSVPRVQRIETELAQNYPPVNFPSHQDPPRSSVQAERTESLTSDISMYSSPSTLLDTPHEYASSHNWQASAPTCPLPTPTRMLSDVPESPCIPNFLPSPSPPVGQRKIAIGLIDEVTEGGPTKITDEPPISRSESRQERVRARKTRDIAALREQRGSREAISDAPSVATASRASSHNSQMGSSPQARKVQSVTRDEMRRDRSIITPIMVVADLAPRRGMGRLSNQLPKSSLRVKANELSIMSTGTYTPPRSSVGSDSDITSKMTEANGFSASNPSQPSEQGLKGQRQERRIHRNMSLREKELENRLRKIEGDNAMLLNTLSGIAGSFGQLNNLLPRPVSQADSVLVNRQVGSPYEVVEDIQNLEPVIKRLQAGARRMKMEEASMHSGEDEVCTS